MGAAGQRFVANEFGRREWARRYLAILEGILLPDEPYQPEAIRIEVRNPPVA